MIRKISFSEIHDTFWNNFAWLGICPFTILLSFPIFRSYVSRFWNKRSFIIYLIMIYFTFFTTITINWFQIDKQIKIMNNFLKAVKKSVNGFLFQSSVLLLWINQNIFLLWFPIVVGFEEIFCFFFVKNKLNAS